MSIIHICEWGKIIENVMGLIRGTFCNSLPYIVGMIV